MVFRGIRIRQALDGMAVALADTPLSFIAMLTVRAILFLVVLLQDLYSYLRYLLKMALKIPDNKPGVKAPQVLPSPSMRTSCKTEGVRVSRGEAEMVMAKLGIFGNPPPCADDRDKGGMEPGLGAEEMACVFEEEEPSLEEVKEAFCIFDEDCNGVIDAGEVANVLHKLGLREISQEDCEKLIEAYDTNKDGVIDFGEFKRLVEKSFA